MNKHTPGPWVMSKTQRGGYSVYTKHNMYNITDQSAPGINAEANARLIAAAPDLLEALQALLEIAEGEYPREQWAEFYKPILDAQAAIAKATGGAPKC